MVIWRMSVACWIPKATNTHSQYVIRTAVPLQELSLERTALLSYSKLRVLVCTEENLYSADRVWFVYCTGSFVERFSCIVFTRTVRLQGWKVTVEPTGHYMYRQFNIQQFYVLPTQCIYEFCVDLRTNSHYFPIQH
jgi:hypothetical protein